MIFSIWIIIAASGPQAVLPQDSDDETESNIEMEIQGISSQSDSNGINRNANSTREADKKGMVLPFTPLAMSFDKVNYYVDMPPLRHHFTFSLSLFQCHHTPYSRKTD